MDDYTIGLLIGTGIGLVCGCIGTYLIYRMYLNKQYELRAWIIGKGGCDGSGNFYYIDGSTEFIITGKERSVK